METEKEIKEKKGEMRQRVGVNKHTRGKRNNEEQGAMPLCAADESKGGQREEY